MQQFRDAASSRRRGDVVLLDGEHLVDDALAAGVRLDVVLLDERARARHADYRNAAARVFLATAPVIAAASPVRTPSGVVALAAWSPAPIEQTFAAKPALAIGLVDVQDPGNVGGVIRSADALGASGVAALDRTADPAG